MAKLKPSISRAAATRMIKQRASFNFRTDKAMWMLSRASETSLVEAGAAVALTAKHLAAKRTGEMAESIHHKLRKARNRQAYTASVQTGEGDRGHHYGLAQEIGIKSRPNYTFTPFLRPAVAANADNIIAIIRENVKYEAGKIR